MESSRVMLGADYLASGVAWVVTSTIWVRLYQPLLIGIEFLIDSGTSVVKNYDVLEATCCQQWGRGFNVIESSD